MKFYARISSGKLKQGYCLDVNSFELTQKQYPLDIFIQTDSLCDPDSYYFQEGKIIPKPIKPTKTSIWSDEDFIWIENESLKNIEIKMIRNKLLSQSDWTQLPDVPLSTKQAWATYRQALRDITTQEGYPFSVIWPTKPE